MFDVQLAVMFGVVGLFGAVLGAMVWEAFRPSKPTLETGILRERNRELTIVAATLSVALDEACDRLANEFGWDKDETYDRYYEEAGKKL